MLQAQIARVEDADKQARSRTKGAAKVRNLERRAPRPHARERVRVRQDPVRRLARGSERDHRGRGPGQRRPRAYAKPILKVTRGDTPGTVDLVTAAGLLVGSAEQQGSGSFHWQWTADGGRTFNDTPATPTGKTTITNLPPLTVLGFRSKVTTTASPGEWSQIVNIIVH